MLGSMLMGRAKPPILARLLAVAAALLVLKVTATVVLGYPAYLPPDFSADFLLGRETYFWGHYAAAFYVHLASGPLSLLLGTLLIGDRFRQLAPWWHRRLGRLQVALILLFVVPSGLVMAPYAMTGSVAAAGLGSLAVATAVCAALGWKSAMNRRFADHQRWMWRTYLLLCSAVVIRLMGGLATVLETDALWVYPFSNWASWLAPLAASEAMTNVEARMTKE
jgi:hypothetical protein